MSITTLSSREFNQNTSSVIIADRGGPAHVLLTIDAYRKLTGKEASIVDLLAMPGAEQVDFEPGRAEGLFRTADLS